MQKVPFSNPTPLVLLEQFFVSPDLLKLTEKTISPQEDLLDLWCMEHDLSPQGIYAFPQSRWLLLILASQLLSHGHISFDMQINR